MKKILCFGDSNTYGYVPGSGKRYDKNTRWTGVLQQLSHGDFEITEAGCNNRTAFSDNPAGDFFTGCKVLPTLLRQDFDFIILFIGINDLQFLYNKSLENIKLGIENLVSIAQKRCLHAKILLLSPASLGDGVLNSGFSVMFDKTSIEKSKCLVAVYKTVSDKTGCYFVDMNTVAKVSEIDGLHYSEQEHEKIAYFMFEYISKL